LNTNRRARNDDLARVDLGAGGDWRHLNRLWGNARCHDPAPWKGGPKGRSSKDQREKGQGAHQGPGVVSTVHGDGLARSLIEQGVF
jgi:hypothetical protein